MDFFITNISCLGENNAKGYYERMLNMIGCLIIHGYTGGPHEVEPLAAYLEENTDWQIVVPTLPGHGLHLKLENVSYRKWLKAAEASLKKLKQDYDEIYLIGFSMGGMIAAYLAAKYNVDKLVLLATAGKFLSVKRMILDIGEVVKDGIRGNLHKNHHYVRLKRKLGKVPMQANIEFLKLVRFTRNYLKDVKTPVLIAQGQQDSLVPVRAASYLDNQISSTEKKVVLFEKSDHQICLGEDKDVLNSMVLNFLLTETD